MVKFNYDLVLEGGGARCAFSLGAIDYFIEKEISFNNVYGVSAGSIAGALFISGQKDFIKSLSNQELEFKSADLGKDGLVDLYDYFTYLDREVLYFDFEAFKRSEMGLYAVLLNADTGQSEYFDCKQVNSKETLLSYIAASCSIPGFAKPVRIDGRDYYDGGYSDPIPIFRSYRENSNKKIIILTREKDYFKTYEPVNDSLVDLVPYKRVIFSMENRYVKYNDSKEFSLYLARNSDGYILMPQDQVKLSTLGFDLGIIENLHNDGYRQAEDIFLERIG